MALYHLSVKNVSRGQGRSAIAAAAYRSGQRLRDEYYGLIRDYSLRNDVVHREIILPPNAPHEFYDRATLWNAVEFAEKRKDSRTAREIEVALPNEPVFTLNNLISLVKEFVTGNFVNLGMCADFSIHDKHNGNPHSHILLTTRPVNNEGFCVKKNRDWDKRSNVNLWREQWARAQNAEYERQGLDIRVSHESYADRGINHEPTIHRGPVISALEKQGIRTERGNRFREIEERNRIREDMERVRQADMEYAREYGRDFERSR